MQKWWSVLFGVVMSAAVLLFVVAPFVGWWMPKNVSTYGGAVDGLFYFILGITGFFFILTEALMVYFMYTYAGGPGSREHVFGHHYAEGKVLWTSFFKSIARPVTKVIHNQHRLELAWTFIPAVILLVIAFGQVKTWEWIKYNSSMPDPNKQTQQIEVSARQFEWRVRYPSPQRMAAWQKDPEEAKFFAPRDAREAGAHEDDVFVVNEVHTWSGQKVLVHLRTRDVIHSFYLPNLRLKQDALPGKIIKVWFEVKKEDFNTKLDPKSKKWVDGYDPVTQEFDFKGHQIWELACAELCGWGHYKMLGRLYVHENEADFLSWLKSAQAEQNRTQPSAIQDTTTADARK